MVTHVYLNRGPSRKSPCLFISANSGDPLRIGPKVAEESGEIRLQRGVAERVHVEAGHISDGERAEERQAEAEGRPHQGVNVPLGLNSKLHSERADNLIRVVLDGIRAPATREIGFMPAFRHSLDDAQIESLVVYMRSRYAPGQPAWQGLPETVSRLRGLGD